MEFLSDTSVWIVALVFVAAGAVVWVAGTRLSRYADAIARRTGLGQAVIGVLLLGGVTSLPEIAVTGTASLSGNPALAANNLLGGFAMQVTILAIADAMLRQRTLTTAVPEPVVLLQGVLGMLILSLVAAGILVGDLAFAGAGFWTWGVFGACVFAIRLVARAEGHPSWKALGEPPQSAIDEGELEVAQSTRRLVVATAVVALLILGAGYVLSTTGEMLAQRTGLGDSFFGAVFVAISTSLPEISTVIAAMRIGRPVMAVSDIFGTNLFDIAVLVLVDLLYGGAPVLNQLGTFSALAAALGIAVTGIYVVGLIERRDRTFFGVGLDSVLVVVTYLGGVGLLYTLS